MRKIYCHEDKKKTKKMRKEVCTYKTSINFFFSHKSDVDSTRCIKKCSLFALILKWLLLLLLNDEQKLWFYVKKYGNEINLCNVFFFCFSLQDYDEAIKWNLNDGLLAFARIKQIENDRQESSCIMYFYYKKKHLMHIRSILYLFG